MAKSVIDIVTESTPRMIPAQWGSGPQPSGGSQRREIARGIPRLVIDIRVRRTTQLLFGFIVTSLLMVGALALSRATTGQIGQSAFAAAGGIGLLAAALFVFGGGLWSAKQTIEVDPRFITVTQGNLLMSFCLRNLVTEVGVVPLSTGSLRRLASQLMETPRVKWGTDDKTCGSAGAGIDDRSALRVADAMREFLSQNPPEAGFDYFKESAGR